MNSYIHKIFVHHNYVKKHFEIDISAEQKEGFRNLIFTGKNGTGKSTLLRTINKELFQYKAGILPPNVYFKIKSNFKKQELQEELQKLSYPNPKVELIFGKDSNFIEEDLLLVYIPTFRNIPIDIPNRAKNLSLKEVLSNQNQQAQYLKQTKLEISSLQQNIKDNETILDGELKRAERIETQLKAFNNGEKDSSSAKQIGETLNNLRTQIASKSAAIKKMKKKLNQSFNTDLTINPYVSLSKFFLQYLVDMKKKHAYAIADEEEENIKRYSTFFTKLEELFKYLYEDATLKLKHSFKENKFYFQFNGGRTADFSQLADGLKSILIIIAEILLQKEAFIEENNLEQEPSGIVLIDEIEAHLHLSLQEKIFPAISNFFPKLQFILATHSPQVCASDTNSYVYDLSSNHLEKNYLGGISYDVLSKAHFGLESEYSIETTKLLNKAKQLLQKTNQTEADISTLIELEKSLTAISPELAYELVLFLRKKELIKNGKR